MFFRKFDFCNDIVNALILKIFISIEVSHRFLTTISQINALILKFFIYVEVSHRFLTTIRLCQCFNIKNIYFILRFLTGFSQL